MNVALHRNINSRLKGVNAFDPTTITAGSGADDTAQDGNDFNRFTLTQTPLSASLMIPYNVAGLDGEDGVTLSITIQDSADGETWEEYGTQPNDISITENGSDLVQVNVDLGGARQHVRCQLTANFDAGSTDTIDISAVWALAGFEELPVTESSAGESA